MAMLTNIMPATRKPSTVWIWAALSLATTLLGYGAVQAQANEATVASSPVASSPVASSPVAERSLTEPSSVVPSMTSSTGRTLSAAAMAVADPVAGDGSSAARTEKDRKRPRNVPSDEGMGLFLAKQHLQPLVPVLDHLRKHSPQQYEKALRDLDRSAKRLESIKRRDAKLYEISLREWQMRGQIDLLKAKLRVKNTDADQQEMLQRLKMLRRTERARIERELVLIDEREAVHQDRMEQLSTLVQRGAALRAQLQQQLQRLDTEPLDTTATSDSKAIEASANEADRPTPSSKPKFKKATNE